MGKGSGFTKSSHSAMPLSFLEGEIQLTNTDPVGMSLRMTAAQDYVANSHDEDIRDHYLWLVRQMMADFHQAGGLEVLTTPDLVATVVAWMSTHSRVVSGREERGGDATILHLIQ